MRSTHRIVAAAVGAATLAAGLALATGSAQAQEVPAAPPLVAGQTTDVVPSPLPPKFAPAGTFRLHFTHGIPGGPSVDLYVNGSAVATGVAPLTSTPAIFAPRRAANATVTRYELRVAGSAPTGAPLLTATEWSSETATSLVAVVKPGGALGFEKYAHPVTFTAPGVGRLDVKHYADAPAVDIVLDGTKVATDVARGDGFYFGYDYVGDTSLKAGDYTLALTAAGTDTVVAGPVTVRIKQGYEVGLFAVGSLDAGTLSLVAQERFVYAARTVSK